MGGEINFDYTYYRLTHKRYSNMDGNNVAYTYHPGGRIESITDGTGHRKLGYDALGNLVHEDRYIAIPNSANVIAFHTEYTYDSWGRMRTLRYPDGEQVTYTYRWGGDLFSVHGTKGVDSCRYVDSIAYNAYGQRSYIHYGNGTHAQYSYDALHRLIYLESRDSLGDPMQQIKYAFDPSSNITHIANNAPNIGPLGGRYQNHYDYDPLHRLTHAGGSNQYRFEQAFELSRAGRPLSMLTNGMVKHYAYGEHTPPHAPQRIMVEDGYRRTLHDLRWDPAGNLGQVSTLAHDRGDIQSRFLFWTEDNRLHTVVDDRHHSYYAYDHAGERTLKVTGRCDRLDINAWILHTVTSLRDHTVYPSPYIVLSNHGYTKHYYAGSERLAARIGGGFGRAILHEQTDLTMTATHLFKQSQHHSNERHLNAPPAHTIRREGHLERVFRGMEIEFAIPEAVRAEVHLDPEGLIQAAQNIVSGNTEPDVYFYHSDHLGSASWITDGDGKPVQHLQYLPYGEPFVNQRAAGSTYSERFRFTGKERDEETGFGYFGARYMDHELMTMWLSVDPLADKYPNISPYAYCAWNPIKLVDPDGREIDDYFTRSGKYLGTDNAKTDNIRIIDESAWNELSDNGTIDHFVGNKNSESFASAHTTMSQESQLYIYQHYNPTKCKLYATSCESDPNRAGMITSTKKGVSRIGIYLEANFKGIAVANHANEIVNMFIHEGQHVIDHKKDPNMADFEYENSALMAQFHHVSWARCRLEFKKSVTEYARKVSTLGSSYIDLFDPTSDIWK